MKGKDVFNGPSVKRKRGRPRNVKITESTAVIPLLPKVALDPILVCVSKTNGASSKLEECLQKSTTILPETSCSAEGISKSFEGKRKPYDDDAAKTRPQQRNRSNHNAEEQRRKKKINTWIEKLGELICEHPNDRKSKISILSKTFEFVDEKKNKGIECTSDDNANAELLKQIKQLETLVLILIELMKKHSVGLPHNALLKKYAGYRKGGVAVIDGCENSSRRVSEVSEKCLPSDAKSSVQDVRSSCDVVTVRNQPIMSFTSVLNHNSTYTSSNNTIQNTGEFAVSTATTNHLWRPMASLLPQIDSTPSTVNHTDAVRPSHSAGHEPPGDKQFSFNRSASSELPSTAMLPAHSTANSDINFPIESPSSARIGNELLSQITPLVSHSVAEHNVENSQTVCLPITEVNNAKKSFLSNVQVFGIDNILVSEATPVVCSDRNSNQTFPCATTNAQESTGRLCEDPVLSITNNSGNNHNVSTVLSDSLSVAKTLKKLKSQPQLADNLSASVSKEASSFSTVKIISNRTHKTRLPSAGHTVAALLESTSAVASHSVVLSSVMSSCTRLPSVITCEPITSLVSSSSSADLTSSCENSNVEPPDCVTDTHLSNTTKRWESVVVNAHKNNMLMTSFILGNKKHIETKNMRIRKNINASHRRRKNRKVFLTRKSISTKANKAHSVTEATVNIVCTLACTNSPVSVTLASVPSSQWKIGEAASNSPTMESQIVRIVSSQSCEANNDITKSVNAQCNAALTSNTSIPGHIQPQSTPATVTGSTTSTRPVRTMKDRTIKNKWLHMERTKSNPILSVATCTELVHDQCASPVISYPNTAVKNKRYSSNGPVTLPNPKRKMVENTTIPCSNEKSQVTLTINGYSPKNSFACTSSLFSAESLCQPDHKNRSDKKRAVKTEIKSSKKTGSKAKFSRIHLSQLKSQHQLHPKHTEALSQMHPLPGAQQQMQQLHVQHHEQEHQPFQPLSSGQKTPQKLNHPNLAYSTPLPTILNIFAPAPVPTSHIQQTNMQAGLSNFSTETLLNGNCHLNMITNPLQDQNFPDNMLMGANFTNFSADTLISGNESNVPYAVDNLSTQNSAQMPTYWNQPWLSHDISNFNEPAFQMSNMQNNLHRSRAPNATTDCSPIKSIMSILQTPQSNNPSLSSLNYIDNFSSQLTQNRNDDRQKRVVDGAEAQNTVNTWNKSIQNNFNGVMNNAQINSGFFNFQQNSQIFSSNMNKYNASLANHFAPSNRCENGANFTVQPENKQGLRTSSGSKQGPTLGNFSLVNSS